MNESSITYEWLMVQVEKQQHSQLYALVETGLLDGIKSPPEVVGSKARKSETGSLLAGTRESSAVEIGPRLIKLVAKTDIDWLIQNATPKGAVSWIVSKTDFDELTDHLRKCTNVVADDGESYFWRFYDPISLGALESVLDQEQFIKVTHPIQHWIWINPWLQRQEIKMQHIPIGLNYEFDFENLKFNNNQVDKLADLSLPGSLINVLEQLGDVNWNSMVNNSGIQKYAIASHFIYTAKLVGITSFEKIVEYTIKSNLYHPDCYKIYLKEKHGYKCFFDWFDAFTTNPANNKATEIYQLSTIDDWTPVEKYASELMI